MIKPIPIRLDYYQYCVETWIEIFKQIDFSRIEMIVDLCLGWAPKIELALLKTDFRGKVIAVDKSRTNLGIFLQLIEPFEKRFTIKTQYQDILKTKIRQQQKGDIVIANHIIDDLILDYYSDRNYNLEDVLSDPSRLKRAWEKIFKNDFLIEEVFKRFKNYLTALVNNNGYLIIAQYQSYQEKLYRLDEAYILCDAVFKKIKKELIELKKFTDNSLFINQTFNKIASPYFRKTDIICLKKIF